MGTAGLEIPIIKLAVPLQTLYWRELAVVAILITGLRRRGGNYWDDCAGQDNDGDGIGDTPYFKDRYPLMKP